MSWPSAGFERRHVVSIEDHLYHTAEMLDAIGRTAPALLACTTVCTIDGAGPDTTAAIADWLSRYPAIQVAACVDRRALRREVAPRLLTIDAAQLGDLAAFGKLTASLLLPGGVLVQDVHLSTLRFIPPDRWWESIYVAATVRGLFARQTPAVRFISNKRGYTATFGRDLMDAGFDPRDVMDKAELEQVIVPSIARDIDVRFPLDVATTTRHAPLPMAQDDDTRRDLEARMDLVDWDVSGRVELAGRLLSAPVTFRSGSHEGQTWQSLIADRIQGGPGIPIADVGQRLAEPGAARAEISNLAARHIHALRTRLSNPSAIVTANHTYRLDPGVSAARVRRR